MRERSKEWHIETIEKLKKIVESCKTIQQYDNAMYMIFRYHVNRSNNAGIVNLMVCMEDYALAKGKLIYLDELTKKNKNENL